MLSLLYNLLTIVVNLLLLAFLAFLIVLTALQLLCYLILLAHLLALLADIIMLPLRGPDLVLGVSVLAFISIPFPFNVVIATFLTGGVLVLAAVGFARSHRRLSVYIAAVPVGLCVIKGTVLSVSFLVGLWKDS